MPPDAKPPADLAAVQAGRLRHDFEERIRKSVHDFRREMVDRLEATIASIETAIETGLALRQRGEAEAAVRQRELGAVLARLDALEARVRA